MTRLTGPFHPTDSTQERQLAIAILIVVGVFGVLLARLFYLQVLESDRYRVSAERNSVRNHRVKATRGMILDRNGVVLVDSRPSFDLLAVPHEATGVQTTLERLGRLVGLDHGVLAQRWDVLHRRSRFRAVTLAHDIGRDALSRVEVRLWALPGVLTQVTPVRAYRFSERAAHVLGRLGEISPAQLDSRTYQGYRPGDVVGQRGVEQLRDRDLRGRDGGRNVLVDAYGRELERLDELEPEPGHNVRLTLDIRLQQAAEQALDDLGKAGAVVALDPATGAVLVLASRPGFNPNDFAVGVDPENWDALVENPEKPMLDRAIRGQYPPGSTYKVVTLIAGLQEGIIKPGFEVNCSGSFRLGRRRYRCWKHGGHGRIRAHRALVQSCDVFFYQVGLAVGVDKLAYYARQLGLGSRTGIELQGERAGLIPTRAWKEKRFGEPWIQGETVSLAIGQGFNLLTPIQLASAYATIATGGQRFRPYLIERVEDPNGTRIFEKKPEPLPSAEISAETFHTLQAALLGVVQEPHGTGYIMRRLEGGVEAAGKTGTAQVIAMDSGPSSDGKEIPEEHRDHAWFVTYAPAGDPRIVVAVIVEHGGHGGSVAAPIARKVVQAFLKNESDTNARN